MNTLEAKTRFAWWADLPLGWKLSLLPVASLLGFALVTLETYVLVSGNHKLLGNVSHAQVPALETTLLLHSELDSLQRAFQDAVAAQELDGLAQASEIEQRIQKHLSDALGNPSLDLSSVKYLRNSFQTYYAFAREISAQMIAGNEDPALVKSIEDMRVRYLSLRDQTDRLVAEARGAVGRLAGTFKAVEQNWKEHFWLLFWTLAGGFAVFIPMTRNLTRSITAPLLEIVEASQRFEKGDLSVKIVARSQDETGRLAKAFGEMIGRIATLVEQIGDSSGHLASSAMQISASTDGLAQGGDRQAQGTAEAARSAEMFAESAREVSGRVDRAHEISARARETAAKSAAVLQDATDRLLVIARAVEKAVSDTERLASHATSIGKVAGVIRDIAGKTKLLSLNAAIEAARAGEHGRGFEVVANEVGTLATNSAASIGEVEGQLGGIQQAVAEVQAAMEQVREAVQSSAHLGEQAGAALQSLVSGAEETKGVLADLAGAAGEQAATASSLSQQMETIASATHENAMNTEEIAGTARELARLASELQRATAFFRFEKKEETPAEPPAPAVLPSLEKEIPVPSGEPLAEAA